MSDIIAKLKQNQDLSRDDIDIIMDDMLSGKIADDIIVEFLSLLSNKGETNQEISFMLEKLQKYSVSINLDSKIIDMCGTGGDMLNTFNISTCASFIAAAAGAKIAKHGNRSNSGVGSADIFEYFGYDLYQSPHDVTKTLEKHNITFIFAQKFHPAMKHVASARKKLAHRTIFNLLGPLSNPARIKNQLIGVSSSTLLYRIPKILQNSQNIMTVHSENGMDEFSTNSTNKISYLHNGIIDNFSIKYDDVGLHKSSLSDIQLKNNAIPSFIQVLDGTANRAMIETAALNSAGGLVVSEIVDDLKSGVEMSLDVINSGKAFELFRNFVADTGDITKLEIK